MTWFYLSILSALGAAIGNIFARLRMQDDRTDGITVGVAFQFLGALIVGIFALLHGFVLPPISQYPINFLLQATLWGLSTITFFKTAQYLEASDSSIILSLSSIVAVIAAVTLIGEHFGAPYMIGTLLVMAATVILFFESTKRQFNKGVLYALAHSLTAGIATVNDGFMLHHSDTLSYLTIGWLTPGIFLLLVKPGILKQAVFIRPSFVLKIVPYTFFYAIGGMAYFFAISLGGQVSQASMITQMSTILTVLMGIIFLKERDHLTKKVLCAVLVTIGVILLS